MALSVTFRGEADGRGLVLGWVCVVVVRRDVEGVVVVVTVRPGVVTVSELAVVVVVVVSVRSSI